VDDPSDVRARAIERDVSRSIGGRPTSALYDPALHVDEDDVRQVIPFPKQDSSMLSPLAQADCLVVRPPFAPAARAGTPVEIIPLGGAGLPI